MFVFYKLIHKVYHTWSNRRIKQISCVAGLHLNSPVFIQSYKTTTNMQPSDQFLFYSKHCFFFFGFMLTIDLSFKNSKGEYLKLLYYTFECSVLYCFEERNNMVEFSAISDLFFMVALFSLGYLLIYEASLLGYNCTDVTSHQGLKLALALLSEPLLFRYIMYTVMIKSHLSL